MYPIPENLKCMHHNPAASTAAQVIIPGSPGVHTKVWAIIASRDDITVGTPTTILCEVTGLQNHPDSPSATAKWYVGNIAPNNCHSFPTPLIGALGGDVQVDLADPGDDVSCTLSVLFSQ